METVHAIELRHITKRFGKVVANDDIDLALDRGEILSLLGENGSGKTTLMNMLSGIYFPDEGEILVEGRPVAIRSPKDAFDHGIGMIHQHFKLIDVFTAAENIVLGLHDGSRLDRREIAAKVKGDQRPGMASESIPTRRSTICRSPRSRRWRLSRCSTGAPTS